ncbi:MAG: DNA polymerase IV [Patescibacteria group bacterium]
MQNLVLHLDGDAFFVGCELTRRPDLRGLPVVTGAERGIASAMSYEAKRLGVTRGYPIFKLRKDFPQVVVLPGDYELYEQYANRMYTIVRRFSNRVEEYSIDECFAQLRQGSAGQASHEIAREVKSTLARELGMTFSVGVAPTKVLAKLASKRDKPNGLVCTNYDNFAHELYGMDLGKVWGIGARSLPLMRALGVVTVGDFANQSESWMRGNWNVNFLDLWHELRGEQVYKVSEGNIAKHLSIQKTRTFSPATNDPSVLMGQLAKNIENAFGYARSLNLSASEAQIFIKTEKFGYQVTEFKFLNPIQTPELLLDQVRKVLPSLIRKNEKYRATGVVLKASPLARGLALGPRDLFGNHLVESSRLAVHQVADRLYDKYGGRVLTLGSALTARNMHHTQSARTHLGLPYLGEVC